MALPSSPPITLAQVCAEFGAPANTPLTAFLRGGAYVPATPANLGVPTSLPLGLTQLLGASAATTPPLSASLWPTAVYGGGQVGATATSDACTASYTGGAGAVSYAWERVSGSGTIDSPSSATTTFSGTRGTAGDLTGVFRCKVTRGLAIAYTGNVSMTLSFSAAAITASASPTTITGSAEVGEAVYTSTSCTCTVTGGSGFVTYNWEWVSGDGTIAALNSTSATTVFRGLTPLGSPGTRVAVWRCKVTRDGQTVYSNTVTVTLTWTAAALTASASPTAVNGSTSVDGGTAQTGITTASYSGGSGTVSYLWERVSGDADMAPVSPTSASTRFSAQVGAKQDLRSAVFRCKVTSGSETVFTNTVTATVTYIGGAE